MDRLKPIDLEKANPKRSFRGYEPRESDELFRRAAKEIEMLLSELKLAIEERDRLRAELASFHSQESTLKEALLLAQRTADETRANAHRQADVIVEEAQQRAAQLNQEAQTRLNDVRFEIERLQLERKKFLSHFRALLEGHLAALTEPASPEPTPVPAVPPSNGQEETPEPLPADTPADE
jgi:cell division initiation protein